MNAIPAPSMPLPSTARTGTVLLVEDDPVVAARVLAGLENAGWHTLHARGVEPALSTLARREPDVVVCDYHLADGTAETLLTALNDGGNTVPFIMITAAPPPILAALRRFKAVRKIMSKPAELDVILAGVAAIARQHPTRRAFQRLIGDDEQRLLLECSLLQT